MKKRLSAGLTTLAMLCMPLFVSAQSYSWGHRYDDPPPPAPTGPPNIVFPVEGPVHYTDDYGDARSGGRIHEGNDIIAPKMVHILAAEQGRVVYIPFEEPSYGYYISIQGDDGYTYNYLHINNDTPGTDDGAGGPQNAYAPGITDGVRVSRGQFIAWVGDSGNAESAGSHMHFEIRQPDDTPIDPYPYLKLAQGIYTFAPTVVTAASPTIDTDKSTIVLKSGLPTFCTAGSLIRTVDYPAVYYCGADGKRYVFPNSQTYDTWYKDFSTIKTITSEELAHIQIGGNVTYRPGVKLVKITTDPKVYAVDLHGTLRWVSTSAIAASLYGSTWAKKVDDIPDAFFANYKVGVDITSS